jgi:hypothetical protein
MLIFAPFAFIENYDLARAVWMTILEASLIAITIISLRITNFRPDRIFLTALFLFTLLWYHAVRPVINGNTSILVALFIVIALFLIKAERDRTAGLFLALATIKPQMVVLLIFFVVLWGLSTKRRRLLTSTGLFLGVLIGGSFVLQQDWVIRNLQQITRYPEYTEPGSPGAIFALWWPSVGDRLGWGLSAVLGILIIFEWFSASGKPFKWFLWTAMLTLIITNLIGMRTATANYIALFPALTLVFSSWQERSGRLGQWLNLGTLVGLFLGLWTLFLSTVRLGAGNQPVQNSIMFFPLPVFLLIAFYWMRWWVIRGRTFRIEAMSSN